MITLKTFKENNIDPEEIKDCVKKGAYIGKDIVKYFKKKEDTLIDKKNYVQTLKVQDYNDEDNKPLYRTFQKIDGTWRYLGSCREGELEPPFCAWLDNVLKENNIDLNKMQALTCAGQEFRYKYSDVVGLLKMDSDFNFKTTKATIVESFQQLDSYASNTESEKYLEHLKEKKVEIIERLLEGEAKILIPPALGLKNDYTEENDEEEEM